MTKDFNYENFPANFVHCFNENCPRHQQCLHYLMAQKAPANRKTLTCVNPKYQASISDNDCPFFKSSIPELYAKGITHLLDDIPHIKAVHIKNKMMQTFGHSLYYRFYRKERLLNPNEQECICQFFKEEDITDRPRFDSYVKYYDLS